MFSLFSILLIVVILILLLKFKYRFITRFFNIKKVNFSNNTDDQSQIKTYPNTSVSKFSIKNDFKVFSNNERIFLKREMEELFKGSKEDKLKALKIAKKLSDKSTLHILRMGLKDMDADIIEISAGLIEHFK
tara:strand:- start:904 stop:1299 length:396 start_codon:yes stop_codon:yes gene_type:complete